jgi:hypothetical protein
VLFLSGLITARWQCSAQGLYTILALHLKASEKSSVPSFLSFDYHKLYHVLGCLPVFARLIQVFLPLGFCCQVELMDPSSMDKIFVISINLLVGYHVSCVLATLLVGY